MTKAVDVEKIYDEIKNIIFRGPHNDDWSHISMLMPKFFDDGSGYIQCVGPEPNLFEFESLDDFALKGNQWIEDNKNGRYASVFRGNDTIVSGPVVISSRTKHRNELNGDISDRAKIAIAIFGLVCFLVFWGAIVWFVIELIIFAINKS